MSELISFVASVNKVQTMVDGGLRVVLDFSENDVMQAAQLMECKRFGTALEITAQPLINSQGTVDNALDKRTIRKSSWKAQEAASANDTA